MIVVAPGRIAVWLAAGALVAGAAIASDAREIGPDADFCAEADALLPGQELVLLPGDYRGPCVVRRSGEPGRPIVIRGSGPGQRPRLVYNGQRANVLDVRGDHVVIRGLAIGPTQRGVDGVRVFSRRDVTIEDCEFTGVGGNAIAATHSSGSGLVVRRNVVRHSQATAMYFGCHDGRGCALGDLLVEGNHIRGVRAPMPEIGYGIQVKLNSSGIIRGNIVIDTKGPGIMLYGTHALDRVSVIERNFVMGSLTSSGIVLGGGPAAVRNNIAVHNAEAGIALEDYAHRGLLRGLMVAYNTTHANRRGGITVPASASSGVTVLRNATHPPAEAQPGAEEPGGVIGVENVDCSRGRCFTDPAGLDFSPAPGSVLLATAPGAEERVVPPDDFFGAPRARVPAVGAVEPGRGPVGFPLQPWSSPPRTLGQRRR